MSSVKLVEIGKIIFGNGLRSTNAVLRSLHTRWRIVLKISEYPSTVIILITNYNYINE